MRAWFIGCILTFGFVIPFTAQAETIHLKNGETVEGEITAADDKRVVVALPGVGKVAFERNELASPIEGLPANATPAADQELLSRERSVYLNGERLSVEAAKVASEMKVSKPKREQTTDAGASTRSNPQVSSTQPVPQVARGSGATHQPQQPSDYKPVRRTRYGASEQSVASAQRDLEYAIRHNAPDEEIERLRQAVRANRENLASQEEAEKEMEARQEAEERRTEERKQAKKAKEEESGSGELAERKLGAWSKPVEFGSFGGLSVGTVDSNGSPVTLHGQDAKNYIDQQQAEMQKFCAGGSC